MRITTTLAALAVAAPALASDITVPSGTYMLDPTHSRVFWTVNHFGLSNYTAQFNGVTGKLTLDAENPAASSVEASVDMATVLTGHPLPQQADFDAELRNPQWLDAAQFPTATFKSTKVEVTGDRTGTMEGDLTFRGVTKPVMFDVTFVGEMGKHPFAPGAAIGFSADGTIKRSDFGLTTFLPNVGDEVQLTIATEFLEQK